MSEQEIILLRKENARLNRMMEALLTANEALRQENALLKTENAPPEFGYSVTENDNGRKEFSYSIVKNENGIKGFGYSIVENHNGITEVLPPLPEKVEPVFGIVLALRDNLKTGTYIRAKNSGLKSQAIMLIHFHNKGTSSHPELRNLTGLSEGGLSKSIMALAKRGLIMRDGFQRFALIPAAKELLKQSVANPIAEWGKKQTPAV